MNQQTNAPGFQASASSAIADREHRVAEARKFNLLSNVFMSVALNDRAACQHVLRLLTGIQDLVVKEIRVQYRISKIQSHDAILDVLAEDGLGKLYNLEIQRSDTIDHARRTRFYGAMIDSEYLQKGKTYAELPDVYIIYISETDLWEANHTAYPVRKHFENTAVPYEDGQRILYVNASVDDGSPTAKLMQYFKTADPQDMSQGDLSLRIHYLKCEEGGYAEMCEVSEKIFREGVEKGITRGIQQGLQQGIQQGTEHTVRTMLKHGFTDAQILLGTGITENRLEEIKHGVTEQVSNNI